MIAVSLLLLSMLTQMPTSPSPPLTVEAIRAAPAPTIAARLIGPEQAAVVERVEVEWDRMLPGAAELRLFHRPTPFAEDLCSQRVHYVRLLTDTAAASLPRDRQPLRVGRIYESETIALAPSCRTAPDQSFAYINPSIARSDAMAMLRSFAAVHAAAQAAGPLPFRLICRDELEADPDACRAGARRALAAIRPERIWLITRGDDDQDLRLVIGNRGSWYWAVQVRHAETDRAEVTIVWKEPAPF